MADDYGTGVSRTLAASGRQFTNIIFQSGKPPLDAELNLQDDIASESLRNVLRQAPSGFLGDGFGTLKDFVTDESYSNFFYLGRPGEDLDPLDSSVEEPVVWASVNGWMVPVAGTAISATVSNQIRLSPAPATDSRIDLVFLEVWRAQVAPNPSTTNKPSASTLYKYGNVEYGGTNITDELEDPSIGFETTERVQLQYRIRVFGSGVGGGAGVSLDAYPDGIDDPNVLGQGSASAPVSGFTFENMRQELGDAGLWRAGDGVPTNGLGTVDGYVYAVPIAAVFRRNGSAFTAVSNGGNPNQNGAYDRNRAASLLSDPRTGAKTFTTPTLTSDLDSTTTGVIQVDNLTGSPLADSEFLSDLGTGNKYLVLGEGEFTEVVQISAVDTTASPATITVTSTGRARAGTDSTIWAAGTPIRIYTPRPDGLYADQISATDILDLRRTVNPGGFDYTGLLQHNLGLLFSGDLRSSYKQNGAGGDTEGAVLTEVDYMWAGGTDATVPNHTELVDGPDGVRTIFSDAPVYQGGITTLLDSEAGLTSGFTSSTFDDGLSWGVDPGFVPTGWINDPGTPAWADGSIIFLHIGGTSGSEGARGSFAAAGSGESSVRFVGPKEYHKGLFEDGDQTPFSMQFPNYPVTFPASPEEGGADDRVGALYPRPDADFERPFIVLGGIARSDLQITTGISTDTSLTNLTPGYAEVDVGVDFDATVDNLFLNETRSIEDLITAGGTDPTGESSELYLVLYGDENNPANNGAFKVVGAGTTAGGSYRAASGATSVVVSGLSQGWSAFITGTGQGLTAEFRTQYTSSQDGDGLASGRAAACVVLTDITNTDGGAGNPWNTANTGALALPASTLGKMMLTTGIQYGPGRGAFARVPDRIETVRMATADTNFLRQPLSTLDSEISTLTAYPSGETEWDADHIETWTGRGTDYSQSRYAENGRDGEVFVDSGSKTMVLRPFQNKPMTLRTMTAIGTGSLIGDPTYPAGSPSAGLTKDAATTFTLGPAVTVAVAIPDEYLPKFGRQDIPYHVRTGASDPFLDGINHLFCDSDTDTDDVFNFIGGPPDTSVLPTLFQAGPSSGTDYAGYSTITHPNHPAYQARIIQMPAESSSETSRLGYGIQLPPYLGIARLYGVYERQDYIDKVVSIGGPTVTIPGAFLSDRITPKTNGPENLLRTDAKGGTLHILKDGAEDITGETGDHTYVVPDSAIDITRIPTYGVSGTSFDDFEYVVECVTFGFGRGFIDQNPYVIARRLDGVGGAVSNNTEFEPDMCLAAAAPASSEFYSVYTRTVYQGDPYMTRDGETRQVADYSHRYGQLPQSDAYELNFGIQQYDANGDQIPEKVNPRAVEVLASIDFWTTMGTGKIGGHSGSLDYGYLIGGDRIPDTNTASLYETGTRLFTASETGVGRAAAQVLILSVASLDTDADNLSNVFATVDLPNGVSHTFLIERDTTQSTEDMVSDFANSFATEAALTPYIQAYTTGGESFFIVAKEPGPVGNDIRVTFSYSTGEAGLEEAMCFLPFSPSGRFSISENLTGGFPGAPANAGNGNSGIAYAGLTDRLPLGILVQDSDFQHEAPRRNGVTLDTLHSLRSRGADQPVADDSVYSEVGSGSWVLQSDGSIQEYTAFNENTAPTGTKRYRTYRGNAVAVIDGDRPCGPVRWSAGGFEPGIDPVLKGAVLVGRAFLVRNEYEEAFVGGTSGRKRSDGDELQMLVTTQAVYGSPDCTTEGLLLNGEISPTGYGEGYAAADRYRLEGKPMVKGRAGSGLDPDKELAPAWTSSGVRVDDGC